MIHYKFPIDHFGIAAAPAIAALLKTTGDKRTRKIAKNALVSIARYSEAIPSRAFPKSADMKPVDSKRVQVAITVDGAGQQWLSFLVPDEPMIVYTADPQRPREQHDIYQEAIHGN